MGIVQTSVYSEYSLLQSTNRIESLVKTAKELGYQALALTDHHVMYGAIPFYLACKKHGIKPLLGIELSLMDAENGSQPFLLRLLATSSMGYQELLKLASTIGMKDEKQQYFTKQEWLELELDHCVVILPYKQGPVSSYLQTGYIDHAISWLKGWGIINQKGYLELQQDEDKDMQQAIVNVAGQLKLPTIAAKPIRYTKREDEWSQRLLQAIAQDVSLNDIISRDYLLPTPEEMQSQFQAFPESLLETERLAASINIQLDLSVQLPTYPFAHEPSEQHLRTLCEKGLNERYGEPTSEHKDRLDYELTIINQLGFSDYFLIVWDFMKYARQAGIIVGPGRGSAAGSIVAYCLSITDVDPIKYNLLFERFLNPERVTLPDIDIDFPDHRRDEVIDYVYKRYGQGHVAQILTFGTFAAKAAIRAAAKVLHTEQGLLHRILAEIPQTPKITISKAVEQSRVFQQMIKDEQDAKVLIQAASSIEGLPRHTSTHAAGVIISARPLWERVALEQGRGGIPLTQATMEVVEQVGLLKFDFLGLRNLTLLESITSGVRQQQHQSFDLKKIPMDDEQTYQLLAKGDTTGVFQLESDGMRSVLDRLGPTEFEDIVAVNALYRPGPMEYIADYIDGKKGRTEVSYLHEDVSSILKPTYGVLVYQEQIMQLAAKLAGYSLAEADLLRRAISKKNQTTLQEQKNAFVERSIELGYQESVASGAYQLIERFANYGFNRSHAVAYSMLSYQLAYLKAHYPATFYTSLLSSVWHNHDKLAVYLKEAKQRKQTILPPSIQHSEQLFTSTQHGIRFGLLSIEHVGVKAVHEILKERQRSPFKHLFDFCRRLNPQLVPKRSVESLIKAGVFDEWGEDRAVLLHSLDEAFDYGQSIREFEEETEGLFTFNPPTPSYSEAEPLLANEKLMYEKQALGFYLSGHPVEEYHETLVHYGRITIEEALLSKQKVRIACLIEDCRQITTKKGDSMAFLKINDESNQCEAVVFPKVWESSGHFLKVNRLVFLEGRLDESREKVQFLVDRAVSLENLKAQRKSQTLFLRLKSDAVVWPEVKQMLTDSHGDIEVVIYFSDTKSKSAHSKDFRVEVNPAFLERLKQLIGAENVVVK
ncbi:DNA polymerase III subunit alpha [Alkalicoccobacillus porphyridii]|uniref:DNA polymerase III subunit alpha n=1 Tax=Alkalicoccobacillus porphyridii TaxID=2597270 RepID=A0A554A2X4_9BACI|nr:DNA polymerase III subunit alpha [Alkalicoccobacillus porphyridii]TSB48043.1 DNA polymerase III subunit alpha [Alkalicoccobacillus porphyridii]